MDTVDYLYGHSSFYVIYMDTVDYIYNLYIYIGCSEAYVICRDTL